VLLHDAQELDDDLGAGSDEDLTLAGFLGIVDALESVVEDGSLDHFGGVVIVRFSSRVRGLEVSAKLHVSLQWPRAGRVPNQGSSARVAKMGVSSLARRGNATILDAQTDCSSKAR
jgi:hypothetical protein